MRPRGAPSLELVLIGLVAALLSVAPAASTAAAGDSPLHIGQWTQPFEEGGAEMPRCRPEAGGQVVCKPAAVQMAVLPDGRIFYVNGVEGDENVRYGQATELSPRSREDRARVLDLRGPEPAWTIPTPEDGGGTNPQIRPGADDTNADPFGVAGVPGRPGDGFVGSAWGRIGGPPQEPTSPPDDVQDNDGALFCSDIAQLADGRLLLAGGTDYYNQPSLMDRDEGDAADVGVAELEGIRAARLFDPATDTFTPAADMHYGRWYPTLVTLADGRVLAASGMTRMVKDTQLSQVRRAEVYDPAQDTWTPTDGPESETSLPLYPRLHLMPGGKVLYNGAGETWGPFGYAVDEAEWAFQKLFDPRTGRWETTGLAPAGVRGGAFEVMLPLRPPYADATMLTFGGTLGPSPGTSLATTLSTLTTVHRNGGITSRTTGSLHNRRWFSDGVLLPDGSVLATNGGDKDSPLTPGFEMPVHQAERYDPATGTWTPMASSSRDRVYHISAALLPDGRVLVGGNAPPGAGYGGRRHQGDPFANNDKDPSFEIFSPPYLFRGERPEITDGPAHVAWGSSFDLRATHAGEIVSVVLIRLPSPQHNIDSDQRAVELEFARHGDTLTAVAPPDGVVAPPGFYYLFVNRSSAHGPIPSVARILRIGDASGRQP
jgi:hypothetical protein